MKTLIVVSDASDWPRRLSGAQIVAARDYLTEPLYAGDHPARVFNLCKSYHYQSWGYYVSLLAEARGHKPLPRARTIEDLHSQSLVRHITEGLEEPIQRALSPLHSETFQMSIYFGRNPAKRYDLLSGQLFSLLQAPLLRVHFERRPGSWHIAAVRPITAGDVPPHHRTFLLQAATDYFTGHRRRVHRPAAHLYDLAVLHDPDNPEPPSNAAALSKFVKAAALQRIHAEFVTRADLNRLPQFDALFIRDTTFVNHYTYRFSRRAMAEGLVVIDDPNSILKCNNKVYLAELLARHELPAPRSLLVHRSNIDQVIPALGLPCVLKRPDSSFSIGVVKVSSAEELRARVGELLGVSDLIVAQEYLPTPFDWRIGILDGRPLFVAKYFMAPGHWQIIKHGRSKADFVEGPTVAVPLTETPRAVVNVALKAASLIGDGFYGVDVKQAGNRCYVMEVNDNPNVDAGNEDQILKDALYREVMRVFAERIQARRKVDTR